MRRFPPGRQEDVARLGFHDLRHTFASLVIAAGANPLQIAEALGHSDKTGRPDATLVWKRYGHLYPGSTGIAASRRSPRSASTWPRPSPQGLLSPVLLQCEERQRVTTDGRGWVAKIIADDEEKPDVPPYVVTYCPECAEREFGD